MWLEDKPKFGSHCFIRSPVSRRDRIKDGSKTGTVSYMSIAVVPEDGLTFRTMSAHPFKEFYERIMY